MPLWIVVFLNPEWRENAPGLINSRQVLLHIYDLACGGTRNLSDAMLQVPDISGIWQVSAPTLLQIAIIILE